MTVVVHSASLKGFYIFMKLSAQCVAKSISDASHPVDGDFQCVNSTFLAKYNYRPLLKLGLGGGAVYLIVKEGVFSDSQKKSIEASKRIAQSVPVLDPYLEKIPKAMSKEEMIDYWNSGVKISISALASLPEDSKDLIHKGFCYLKGELKKQMQLSK